ncbi:T9SS type A sorting domain-containing protein, partial [Bacteroidales bacterium OttesenSCG-928-K03]|nr:T9SS type A sorting domain-containing protein [Bacteroidales bacterium OttesenSCG-928-K03]
LSSVMVAQKEVQRVADKMVQTQKVYVNGFEAVSGEESTTFVPTKETVPTFVGSISEKNIGKSVYDWQTNSGARNQMVAWEDGWISATYTQALETDYTDRGSAYAYYDGTTWHESGGKIEDEKTGFSTIARYGENGVVIAAHAGAGITVYLSDNRTGTNWVKKTIDTPNVFPSVMTSGENRDIIHVLTITSTSDGNVVYFRSNDGGDSWVEIEIPFVGTDYIQANKIGSNAFHFMETTDMDHPYIPNRLSFVLADEWCDGQVIYSDNDGDSWNRTVFYNHPDPMAASLTPTADSQLTYPRWVSGAWDAEGYLHIAYEFNFTSETGGTYVKARGGVAYWNESYSVLDSTAVAGIHASTWCYSDAIGEMPSYYMGYVVPMTAEGVPSTDPDPNNWGEVYPKFAPGSYNCGIVGMPSIAIDYESNTIFIVYISIAAGYEIDEFEYFRIFARASQDEGETWSEIEMLTKGPLHALNECVYPWMSNKIFATSTKKMNIIYQQDMMPDTYTITMSSGSGADTDPDDNYYYGMTVNLVNVISIKDYENQVSELEMKVYPNPASSYANIYLDNEAQVNIYNSVGQVVKSFKHNGGNVDLDVQSFKPGVYVIVANSGSASESTKLIVR